MFDKGDETTAPVVNNLVTVSEEPDRGVGIVTRVRNEYIEVCFDGKPGSSTVATLNVDDVQRFQFEPNATIFSRGENAYGTVLRSRVTDGVVTYTVQFGGNRKMIPEHDIVINPQPTDPFEILRAGDTGDAVRFLLAVQGRRLHYAYAFDELVSLSNARIDLLPHQVFVAHRVLAEYPKNFLLADEVGLGKTIEAGLIIKELRARRLVERVLVVVPAGLVPQWVNELRSKFNERFTRLDSSTFHAYAAEHGREAVWETFENVVTSIHFLRGNDELIDAVAAQRWDFIIFDEAHHLRRVLEKQRGASDERRATQAYRLAQRLRDSAGTLLFLTATPLQLHAYELYSLIELLDPALFPTYAEFDRYRARIPIFNAIVRDLNLFEQLSAAQRRALADEIVKIGKTREGNSSGASDDWLSSTLPELTTTNLLDVLENSAADRSHVKRAVENLHTLASIMLRNRKRVVLDDVQPREATMLSVHFSEVERRAYDAVTDYIDSTYNLAMARNDLALGFVMVTYRKLLTSSSYALSQSFKRRISRLNDLNRGHYLLDQRTTGDFLEDDELEELDTLLERYSDRVENVSPAGIEQEVAHLRELCRRLDAIHIDAKARRLQEVLEPLLDDPETKVLIFTQFKETLASLNRLLGEDFRVVTFHGDLNAVEKDQAVDRFRDPHGDQIMIATEAAGEGRNLQFCHIMFNYDLPWNPMRVEQRIGRIDRIGQTHPVQIYNFTIEDTVEDRVLQRLYERIDIFESTVGHLDPILGSIEREVRDLVFSRGTDNTKLESFERSLEHRLREAQEMEAKLEDFILDARSFRRDRTDALLGRRPAFSASDLRELVEQFLSYHSRALREPEPGIVEIEIPPLIRHAISEAAHLELQDHYRATFDPEIAKANELIGFIAFGHDVLDGIIGVCLSSEFGSKTAAIAIETSEVAPTEALCAVFEFAYSGIRPARELEAIATTLDGTPLPDLSERFLELLLRAKPVEVSSEFPDKLSDLDQCIDVIESTAADRLSREELRRSRQNRDAYAQERNKLENYYTSRLLAADKEIDRLSTQVTEYQASSDRDKRRIIPAIQGRLTISRRNRDEVEHERERRLKDLDRQQVVSASSELLGVAYVRVQPSSISAGA